MNMDFFLFPDIIIFLSERFFYDHSTFFQFYCKISCSFSLKLNQISEKKKFALTCSFQQVIQMLAFRGRKKFDISFLFKIPGIGEAAL